MVLNPIYLKLKGILMLVLSRHKDETIVIGDNEIRVTVLDIRGDKVRIGIDAPKDVAVHREEVFDEIQKAKRRIGGVSCETKLRK